MEVGGGDAEKMTEDGGEGQLLMKGGGREEGWAGDCQGALSVPTHRGCQLCVRGGDPSKR